MAARVRRTRKPAQAAKPVAARTRAPVAATAPARVRAPASTGVAPTTSFGRRPVFEELESRLLMSADLNPLAYDTLLASPAPGGAEFRSITDEGHPTIITTGAVAPIQRSHEIAFVDTATPDYERLIAAMRESAAAQGRSLEVVLIDSKSDGIRAITEALGQRSDLTAVHIVSHASDGTVQLGAARLDFVTLAAHSSSIKRWGAALADNADVLFYGCDLTATSEGKSLLEAVARLTGADVAASEDLTGTARRGGDWDLEFKTGAVETDLLIYSEIDDIWDGLLNTFTVDNTNDSGSGSLRQAILNANANGGADTIVFDISSGPTGPTDVKTISLSSPLTITDQVTIDGFTQDGYDGTMPLIELTRGGSNFNALTLNAGSGGSVIGGLIINRFTSSGILINTGSDGNTILGNWIGTDTSGNSGGSTGNANGIVIHSDNNTIGGLAPAARNVISGNSVDEIRIESQGSGNQVLGNFIGTNSTGTAGVVTAGISGVNLLGGNNTIGGAAPEARNVISGNQAGVLIASAGNVVQGNYIGTDVGGTLDRGNTTDGIRLSTGANANVIAGNLVSGNDSDGIEIGGTATGNVVRGNLIGTNAAGGAALPNTFMGIRLTGTANGNIIGGTGASDRNIISGNAEDGIFVDGVTGTVIQGNYIGVSAAGVALAGGGNRGAGIWLVNASATTIGGTGTNARNVISGNGNDPPDSWQGILVQGSNGNLIQGNYVGTDAAGTGAVGNFGAGIELNAGSQNNIVAGNVISGNGEDGVVLWQATANVIRSNLIGTNATGTGALGNADFGIWITNASGNTIGGTSGTDGNVISASGFDGIAISTGSNDNLVQGNRIGTNAAGTAAIPNTLAGIWIYDSSRNTIGGTVANAGNLISGNATSGIELEGTSSQNAILGNSIHANAAGLGIDLGANGVTANDGTDADAGPNALQNFPILSSAVTSGAQIQIKGSLTSTTNTDFRIEFFASTTADGSGHGEGQRFLGSIDVNTGGGTVNFTTPIFTAPVLPGEFVTATATRWSPGFTQLLETSEFGPNFVATAAYEIRGTVFDDVDGDADVAEPGTAFFGGATVRLFRDDGVSVGFIDAGDTLLTNTTTNAAGQYVFTGVFDGTYYVVVDSKTLNPSTAAWAEQTYGVAGAATGGTFTTTAGALYSGRTSNLSDGASTLTLTAAEHVTKVTVGGINANNINSGFSFNVVTNVRGDANDDDTTRSGVQQQGTLRQFIENANATVAIPNAMRFVPVVGANAGGGSWWQISVSGAALPTILDPFTVVDGTAFAASVNGPVVDINNAAVVSTTVGVDDWLLPGLARPELEITDAGGFAVGLNVGASNTTIRDLAIFGFGGGSTHTGDIAVQNVQFTLIEGNVIGAHANLSDPGPAARGNRQAITIDQGDNGTIRGNLIGYTGYAGVDLFNAANNWLVEYNEIRGVGWVDPVWDGVNLLGVNGALIQRNLITNNAGPGIDVASGSSNVTIDNNTISNNALLGGPERYGIDLENASGANVVRRNIISGNAGAGVLVGLAASAHITENSILNNAALGIDLSPTSGIGDGVTANDPGDADAGPNALQNFPVLASVATDGAQVTIVGTLSSEPLTTYNIEFFASAPADPEGQRYFGSAIVSADATGHGSFLVTLPQTVLIGEAVTATATNPTSATSEFSQPVLASAARTISGTIYNDDEGDGAVVGDLGYANALVKLYVDDGDGAIDADDALVITTLTNGAGAYTFSDLGDAKYWVVVDSRTLDAGGYLFGGINDVWAEQTYGSVDSVVGAGFSGASGTLYGGRDALVSDDATTLARAEHVTRVIVAGSDVIDVDSGFSFSAVTSSRDGDDDALNSNRSVQGSLRQFIVNSSAIAGAQTADFSIGAAGSPQSIAVLGAALPMITDRVFLDAWTQGAPGYNGAPLIELNGTGTGAGADGLLVATTSNGSMVRGFVINRFDGDGLHVEGDNTIIVGNYIGTDASGSNTVAGNDSYGVHLLSDFNRVGGAGIGERNVISGNGIDGIAIENAQGNLVLSNYIGTDASGTVAIGNAEDGIWLNDAVGNTIGGAAAPAGNLIAWNNWSGIAITGGSDNLVRFNQIANNVESGVIVHSGARHAILDNSIYNNVNGLGIDLVGVVANDLGDGDGGTNFGMNTPEIYSVEISGGFVTVRGEARLGATVQFFETAPDPSNAGEGQTFLYQNVVAAGLAGTVDPTAHQFSYTFAAGSLSLGDQLTATATESSNSTSEFSANVTAAAPNSPPTTSGIANVTVNEDAPNTLIDLDAAFADLEDPDSALVYTIQANTNPGLVTTAIGAGTLTLGYTANASGGAQLTVRATDTAGAFVETSFNVTVNPVNDAPTTAPVTLAPIAEDSGPRLITQAELLANAGDIDGPGALSATGLAIASGAGALVDNGNGTWTYNPAANDDTAVSFSYTITDTIASVGASATLDIAPVNDTPTITAIADQTIDQDTTLAPVPFAIGDMETVPGVLVLTATSSNQTLVPDANLVLGGGGANRTIGLNPSPGASGSATITISVFDGTDTTQQTFVLTVNPPNAPPVVPNATFTIQENASTGTVVGTVSAVDPDAAESFSKVYWTDTAQERLYRANLDGTGIELLASGLNDAAGVAVDHLGGKIYWVDPGAKLIRRANLDGSSAETVVSAGIDAPTSIKIDHAGGKIYWADRGANVIQRANLDGSGVQTLISGLSEPLSLDLDLAAGKLYFTHNGDNTIRRANLDGSAAEILVTGLADPYGIVLDAGAGRMYWSEPGASRISRANLDGSAVQLSFLSAGSGVRGLAIDTALGKIYWADDTGDRLRRANLDGTGVQTVLTVAGTDPIGIALGPPVQALTYAITAGNTGNAFAINALTGALSVATTAALDYEVTPSFTLTVQAVDAAGMVGTGTVTVSLLNVNEPHTGAVVVSGPLQENQTVVADTSGIVEPDGLGPFSYQWERSTDGGLSWAPIAGANTMSYTLGDVDVGTHIRVIASYIDGSGTLESSTSVGVGPVAGVNDAPVVVTSGGALAYTENDPATPVDAALTVSDIDSATLAGATVRISGGYVVGEDVLTFTSTGGITGVWSGVTATLTLSGPASLADWQTVLRSVAYVNTSDDPAVAARTIEFVVNDGTSNSAPALRTVNVTPVNDAPTTAPVTLAPIGEDSGPRLITQAELLANANDVDGPSLSATGLAIASGAGALVDNGNGTWNYTPAPSDDTAVSFSYTITDTIASLAGSATLDITPANDAPTTSGIADVTVNEDAPNTLIDLDAAFADLEDPDSALVYTIQTNTNPGLVTTAIGAGTLTLGYTANASGSAQLTVRATDTGGAFIETTFNITVNPVNDAPTTAPVTLAPIGEDSGPRLITQAELLANAGDIDGPGALSATGLTIASGAGALVDNGNGTWNYTPLLNDDTAVSFSYTITDTIVSVAASATLDITPVNDAPVANDDGINVAEDSGASTINVLANDSIAPDIGETLTITGVTQGASGTVVIVAGTTVTYTPNSNFFGPDSFTYTVSDGNGGTATATVNVAVTPVNDTPAASDDVYATAEDTTLVFGAPGVLANDLGVGDGPLTLSVIGVPVGGSVSLNNDGSFTFTPTLDFTGTASFTYQVQDVDGETDTATVDILVGGVNDVPVLDLDADNSSGALGADYLRTFTEGLGPVRIADTDAALTDIDSPTLASITVTISNLLDGAAEVLSANVGATGIVANYAGGVLTLSGGTTVADYQTVLRTVHYDNTSDAPSTTQRIIEFVAHDGMGPSNVGTARVTINAVNDAPAADMPAASYAATENVTLTLHGTGMSVADIDVLPSSIVDVYLSSISGLLGATQGNSGVTVVGSGSPTLTLTGTIVQINALLAGTTTGTVTYSVGSDSPAPTDTLDLAINDRGATGSGGAQWGWDSVTVNLTAVNDAPLITIPGLASTPEDTPLVFSTGGGNLISITDVDAAGFSVEVTLNVSNGVLTLAGTAGLAFGGGANGTASMTFSGTVANINAALDGLTFAPTPDYSGPAFLSLSVNDQGNSGLGGALTDADFASITVTSANDAPAGADATIAMAPNTSYAFTAANFGFTDGDAGDTLAAVRIDTLPAAGALTLSGLAVTAGQVVAVADITAGSLVFTPAPAGSGAPYASFTFSVQDSAGAFDVAPNTITVNVAPVVNNPPTGTNGAVTTAPSVDYVFTLADFGFNDPDAGDLFDALRIDTVPPLLEGTLFFGALPLLPGTVVSAGVGGIASGNLYFRPGLLFVGTTSFDFSVRDANGPAFDVVPNTMVVTVAVPSNDPVNVVPAALTVNEDTPTALGGIAVNDPNGNLGTVQLSVGSGAVTVNLAGGAAVAAGANGSASVTLSGSQAQLNAALATLSYQGALNFSGADVLTIRSTDLTARQDVDNVAITINPVNDAPIATALAGYATVEQSALTLHGTLSVSDVDAGAANVTATLSAITGAIFVAPSAGVIASGSGTPLVTLSGTIGAINALLTGAGGGSVTYLVTSDSPPPTDTLSFTINDGGASGAGGPLSATVVSTITIGATNDAPVNTLPGGSTTLEDTPYVFSAGLGNQISITDVDAGAAPLQVTLNGTNGVITLSGTGGLAFSSGDGTADAAMTFTGTLPAINAALNGLVFTPNLDYNGLAFIQLTTNDLGASGAGGALSDADLATIDVLAVNDAPDGTDTTVTLNEDSTYTFNAGIFGFTDVDFGDAMTEVRIDSVSLPAGATLMLGATPVTAGTVIPVANIGNLVFTPVPEANGAGYASFTFSVRDTGVPPGPLFDLAPNTMTVNVTPVNDLPSITSDGGGATAAFVVAENTVAVTTATATDIDLQPLAFSLAGVDAARFSIDSVTGVLTFNPAPNFEAPGDAGADNVYNVTVVVSDGAGGGDSQALTVTVIDANDAPTAGDDAYVTDEELPLAVAAAGVLVNDGDEDGTPVTAVLVTGPANGAVAFNADGSFVYTPNANFAGVDTFTYQASDGALGSALATVTITVNPINDAPSAADGNVTIAAAYAFSVADFNYFDVDGDPLDRIMITALPVEGQLLFDGLVVTLNQEITATEVAAGRLTYVPPTTSTATAASFGFSVSDGTLYEAANHTMTIGFASGAVTPPAPPPAPPVITPPPAPPAEPTPEPTASGAPAEPSGDATPTGGGRGGGSGGGEGAAPPAPPAAEGAAAAAETGQAAAGVVASAAPQVGSAPAGSIGFQSGGVAANPNIAAPALPADQRGEPTAGEVKAEMEAVAAMAAPEVRQALDEMRERAQEDVKVEARVAGSVFVVSTGLSVGYVLWLLRGGALIASLLSSLPAWRLVDPLPVLGSMGGRAGDEDDDSLEDLVANNDPPSVPGEDALADNDNVGSVRT